MLFPRAKKLIQLEFKVEAISNFPVLEVEIVSRGSEIFRIF